jgi:hypothetical protein
MPKTAGSFMPKNDTWLDKPLRAALVHLLDARLK